MFLGLLLPVYPSMLLVSPREPSAGNGAVCQILLDMCGDTILNSSAGNGAVCQQDARILLYCYMGIVETQFSRDWSSLSAISAKTGDTTLLD